MPGFAGVFLDQDGNAVVSLARPGAEAAATAWVHGRGPEHARRPVRFRSVEFSFDQLSDWRDEVMAQAGPDAVLFDVDELRNGVTIGVTTLLGTIFAVYTRDSVLPR